MIFHNVDKAKCSHTIVQILHQLLWSRQNCISLVILPEAKFGTFLEQVALLCRRVILLLLHLPAVLYSSKRMEGDGEQKLHLKSSCFQHSVMLLQVRVRAVMSGWPSVSSAAGWTRLFQVLEWLCCPLSYKENVTHFCMHEFRMKCLLF